MFCILYTLPFLLLNMLCFMLVQFRIHLCPFITIICFIAIPVPLYIQNLSLSCVLFCSFSLSCYFYIILFFLLLLQWIIFVTLSKKNIKGKECLPSPIVLMETIKINFLCHLVLERHIMHKGVLHRRSAAEDCLFYGFI